MLVKPNRLKELRNVLHYCTEKDGYFTTGERICINQERGMILQLVETEEEQEPILIPMYAWSDKLEAKINFLLMKIKESNWQPQPLQF